MKQTVILGSLAFGSSLFHEIVQVQYASCMKRTVHDTENLTFSEEFRGCSVRNDADFPHGCRGTSARADVDFLCGRVRIFHADGHESSVRIRLKMAETRRQTSCATTLKD